MSKRSFWQLLTVVIITVFGTACSSSKQVALQASSEADGPDKVFVLLINSGSQNEGIYAISNEDQQQILMFESQQDAIRYNELLNQQDFDGLAVEEIEREVVDGFCEAQNYECILVTEGTQMIPPEENAETNF